MPTRLIREGLLESEAVLSLPTEARWLFVTIMLSADDLGLFEATEFKLARRADVRRELASKLLQMIGDADLVRFYEVDGKRYGFIPKFRQRVQIKNTRHPLPPRSIYATDSDAVNKINGLDAIPAVGQPQSTVAQPSEAEAEAKNKVSETTSPRRRRKATDLPACPFDAIVAAYHEVLPTLPSVRVIKPGGARAKAVKAMWDWVLTSTKRDGTRRATTQAEGLAWMRDYFTRALDNDFVMGRTARGAGHEGWEASIDYLCSEKGMRQVIEKTKDRA